MVDVARCASLALVQQGLEADGRRLRILVGHGLRRPQLKPGVGHADLPTGEQPGQPRH